jgi:hypothetical protein
MADPVGHTPVRYRFSPLERRGIIAGWRGGQIAAVATSLVLAVFLLRARPTIGGLVIAVSGVGCGVAVAFWPVRGHTPEQWLPLVTRWSLTGPDRRTQLAPGPGCGHVVGRRTGTGRIPTVTTVPSPGIDLVPGRRRRGVFDGVRLMELPLLTDGGDRRAGVVIDGPARTATVALAVRGHSFALLSPTDQESRVAAWAGVLASLAREGSAVHRLQWIESCLPDDGGSVHRHFEDHAVLASESPAVRSYRALLDESAPVTRRHRMLLCLTVHTSRSARAIRASGGGDHGCGAVLGREVLALCRALDGADVGVDGVLGPGALARFVRGAYSGRTSADVPAVSDDVVEDSAGHDGHEAGNRSDAHEGAHEWPWPMAVRPEWDAVQADGTWHATYWIAEWPRVDVTPDFLGPLLFAPLRRSLVVVMEPVSPSRAARQVARARTADIADGELRRRSGFLVSARQHRERHGVEERDAELADGHGQFRFSGYVTLTAESRPELQAAATSLEQLAGQSHLELRRLYGEQDVAFACSLPLGRGLS